MSYRSPGSKEARAARARHRAELRQRYGVSTDQEATTLWLADFGKKVREAIDAHKSRTAAAN